MIKLLKYFLAFAFLLFLSAIAVGGPPEQPDIYTKEKLSLKAETLLKKLDSLTLYNAEIYDTSGLTSFTEIIIDEKGVIKVRTDSGLVVISLNQLESILPEPVSVGTGRKEHDITSWGKDVFLEEDERIKADIIVVSGDAIINGTIEGDVIVFGGNIYVNSTGYISGDAIAIGGHVKKEEGAKITGSTVTISLPFVIMPKGSAFQIIQGFLLFAIIIGVVFSALSISLFPKPINYISEKLSVHPVKSFLFGYIAYIGVFLIWLLLIVSVIGIPLAFFGEPIAFLILVVFAYAATNYVLGGKLFREKSPFNSFLYGGLITTVIPFFLLLTGYFTNSLLLFVLNMILLGFFIFVFLPFGLGATVLARFGFPPKVKKSNTPAELTQTSEATTS